jgi:hypothetical protein
MVAGATGNCQGISNSGEFLAEEPQVLDGNC